jgi:hypothetical protein
MRPSETKAVYEKAVRRKRLPVVQEEAEDWHRKLKGFEMRDVQAGIDLWDASEEVDGRGQLASRWMPPTDELVRLAAQARRKREKDAAEPRFKTLFTCPVCGASRLGFLRASDSTARRCDSSYGPRGTKTNLPAGEKCGALMEVSREAA